MGKFCKIFFGIVDGIVESFTTEQVSKSLNSGATQNYIPQNYIETSIQVLADQAINSNFDSVRRDFADKIMKIISTNWDDISSTTKSYAIMQLSHISNKMDFDSYKKYISSLITSIATGNIN